MSALKEIAPTPDFKKQYELAINDLIAQKAAVTDKQQQDTLSIKRLLDFKKNAKELFDCLPKVEQVLNDLTKRVMSIQI